MPPSFIDTNIWLYRLFDDRRIEAKERERKQNREQVTFEKNQTVIDFWEWGIGNGE